MAETTDLRIWVNKNQERSYLPVYFQVPPGTERITVRYEYPREPRCTIDFALVAPGEDFLGASGSNRSELTVSALSSSRGFASRPLATGRWEIVLGAYEIPEDGVEVVYHITLEPKRRRLFKGDTHLHTLASDGSGTVADIVRLAEQTGLDYVFLTDHNNYVQNEHGFRPDSLTLLPGCEWTHYNGHAVMLGVERPLPGRYGVKSLEEAKTLIRQAQERGAFVSLAHPFCPLVPWEWGMDVPYDGIEVWNGLMSLRNMRAIAWWHEQLVQGRRIPITGGSDYHRPALFEGLGMPCLCLYALSREPGDLLAAIRAGSGYISYQPAGPGVDILDSNGAGVLGGSVPRGAALKFRFSGLLDGDEILLLTAVDTERITVECTRELTLSRSFGDTPFVRAEVLRSYDRHTVHTVVLEDKEGLPPFPAMVANPVYFD